MQNLPIAENRPEFDSVITSISASSFTHIVLSNWIQRHHVRRWGRLMLAEKTKGDRSLRPWQTRTHCSGHIVADTNVSPFARARNICCRHKFCARDTKNVWFCSETFCVRNKCFPCSLRSPRNIMGNNVSATRCPRLPGPLSSPVAIYTPGWREALWELCALPKNTT